MSMMSRHCGLKIELGRDRTLMKSKWLKHSASNTGIGLVNAYRHENQSVQQSFRNVLRIRVVPYSSVIVLCSA